MREITLSTSLTERVAMLYAKMEKEYANLATSLQFSCNGCPDNCCDSYFQHHTYIEWAYLWQGIQTVDSSKFNEITDRSRTHIRESEKLMARGERPNLMCPINDNGLCSLYSHRLMICRLHGVPASVTRPDGKKLSFPGCFRCQELVEKCEDEGRNIDRQDRTDLYRQLVALEMELLGHKRQVLPKVKLTLAQMLVQGPPQFP